MKRKVVSIAVICCMTAGIILCSFTQPERKLALSDEMDTEVTAQAESEESEEPETSNSIVSVSESMEDIIEKRKALKADWSYYIDRNTDTVEIREYTGEGIFPL